MKAKNIIMLLFCMSTIFSNAQPKTKYSRW